MPVAGRAARLAAVGLVLASCHTGVPGGGAGPSPAGQDRGPSPGGQDAAVSEPTVEADWPVAIEPGGVESCSKQSYNDGDVTVGLHRSTDEGSFRVEERLQIASQKFLSLNEYYNATHFDVLAPAGDALLSLRQRKAWTVSPQVGNTLLYRRAVGQARCRGFDGVHPPTLEQASLRDDFGHLLLLTERSSALTDGGQLETAAAEPDVDVRWVDTGCADYPAEEGHEALDARSVAIAVQFPRTSPTVHVARVGESTTFAVGEEEYVLAVASALKWRDDRCGHAVWSVYRKNFIVPAAR